jgi:hypothetical protein
MFRKRDHGADHVALSAGEGRYIKHGELYFYRLDFRSPEIIFNSGFTGTEPPGWNTAAYGFDTVFCSRSLKGIAAFGCEALLGLHADGRPGPGPLSNSTCHPQATAYVYRFCADGLEHIDVRHDLGLSAVTRENVEAVDYRTERNVNTDSILFKTFTRHAETVTDRTLNRVYGFVPKNHEQRLHLEEQYKTERARMHSLQYVKNYAVHTEEVMIKGPVEPSRITLYSALPLCAVPPLKCVSRKNP